MPSSLILNLPMVGLFVNLLRIPYTWLVPAILVISVIGMLHVDFRGVVCWVMAIAGFVGYFLRKFGYEMAPLVLALVLGDRLEENFSAGADMWGGNYATFADEAWIDQIYGLCRPAARRTGYAWAFGYRKAFADENGGRVHNGFCSPEGSCPVLGRFGCGREHGCAARARRSRRLEGSSRRFEASAIEGV